MRDRWDRGYIFPSHCISGISTRQKMRSMDAPSLLSFSLFSHLHPASLELSPVCFPETSLQPWSLGKLTKLLGAMSESHCQHSPNIDILCQIPKTYSRMQASSHSFDTPKTKIISGIPRRAFCFAVAVYKIPQNCSTGSHCNTEFRRNLANDCAIEGKTWRKVH